MFFEKPCSSLDGKPKVVVLHRAGTPVKFVADMENYMNAVERVLEYTDLEHEEDPRKYPIADATFVKGKLAFENVSLGYHLDNRVIVSGLNLTVRPGEKVRRLKILLYLIS